MLAAALALAGPAQAAPRVMSLDQCADQYVLALSPREAIVGVSPRVDDRDSYLRAMSAGLPQRRASAEAVLAAAGLKGAGGVGYAPVSLERLVMEPPARLVLGFFDDFATAMERWGPGRHRVLDRLARERTIGSLPGAIAGCPGWFAADGALSLARGAPR